MRQLVPHAIERSVILQKNEISNDFLCEALDDLGERPDLLPTVFRRSLQLAAGLLATDGEAASVTPLRQAARVAALMFVHSKHARGEPTFFTIDDEHPIFLEGEIDASLVNAPAWVEAMWCAMAVGDSLSQEWLATVSVKDLKPKGVAHGPYVHALGEFLRSLVTHDGQHGPWLIQATEQSSDRVNAGPTEVLDWVDDIDFPALRAAYHAIDGDAVNFNATLEDLLDAHRRYWSASERALAVDGLISLRACALARMASALGLPIDVQSVYMPVAVWHSESIHNLRCPYCVGPLQEGAPACALCGNVLRDAPLELTQASLRTKHLPCKACAYPLHSFAVICPQCRKSRSAA